MKINDLLLVRPEGQKIHKENLISELFSHKKTLEEVLFTINARKEEDDWIRRLLVHMKQTSLLSVVLADIQFTET